MRKSKSDVISFKVEPSLGKLINRIPNKSQFIRQSVLSALQNTCPLCQGTGALSPEQRTHWDAFAAHHTVRRCRRCNALHLSCSVNMPGSYQEGDIS